MLKKTKKTSKRGRLRNKKAMDRTPKKIVKKLVKKTGHTEIKIPRGHKALKEKTTKIKPHKRDMSKKQAKEMEENKKSLEL